MNITNLSFDEVDQYSEDLPKELVAKTFSELLTEYKMLEAKNDEEVIQDLEHKIQVGRYALQLIKSVINNQAFRYTETKNLVNRLNNLIDASGFEL